MKIAVTYENGQVFQHFGHCKQFKIYETGEGAVLSSQVLGTGESGHGALAGFLQELGVEALICGGIGGGARTALDELGIRLYPGVNGSADESVEAFLKGTLAFDPDTVCSHHGEGHHGEGHHGEGHHGDGHHEGGHACGSHHCGEDKQGCAGGH